MTALLRRTPAAQPVPPDAENVYRVAWMTERGPQHSGQLTQRQAEECYCAVRCTLGCYQLRLLTERLFAEWVGEIARRMLSAQ